jgi:hypothetical protein
MIDTCAADSADGSAPSALIIHVVVASFRCGVAKDLRAVAAGDVDVDARCRYRLRWRGMDPRLREDEKEPRICARFFSRITSLTITDERASAWALANIVPELVTPAEAAGPILRWL